MFVNEFRIAYLEISHISFYVFISFIGFGDPTALNQAVAAYQACHFIGMPECDV